MKRPQFLSVLAFLLMPLMLMASQVDENQARDAALRFMRFQADESFKAPDPNMNLAHVEYSKFNVNTADYYVFNMVDADAFIIVSGDDRAQLVLGYGKGQFNTMDVPCGLKWLLGLYKEQMEYLHAHPGVQVKAPSQSLTTSGELYLPLITSDWSQGHPYNDQCPTYHGEYCVTGCIATAMAQVMYFWRYPESCPSVPGYKLTWETLPTLPATTFDWNNMLDRYTGQYTDQQAAAVAKLMRYCGQSASMDYGVNGSGAQVKSQLVGMRLMGYSCNGMVDRNRYSTSAWLSMMKSDLAAGCPILYSGSGGAGGHAFVVDGYDGGIDMFHINWGWASKGNGYFALGAFNVEGMTFNSSQQMLCRVKPGSIQTSSDYDFTVNGIYYKYAENHDEAIVTYKDSEFNTYSGDVVIPKQVTYNGKTMTVTAIGKSAFRNCPDLTRVTLPNTVKLLDDYAFRSCPALTTVVIPDALETIADQVFTNCISLQEIYLPRTVSRIGYKAFLNCTGLQKVVLDDLRWWIDLPLEGLYSSPFFYGHHLFIDGAEVKTLMIPDDVTSIEEYKFAGFSGVTRVVFPQGLTSIGRSAFAGCSSLDNLQFPPMLKTIGTEAFKDCTGLTELVLGNAIQRVCVRAFAGCSGLEKVTFEIPVREIETDAFEGCTGLTEVLATDLLTWLENGFENENSNPLSLAQHLKFGDKEVTSIVFPEIVTAIGDFMFYGFSLLRSVSFSPQLKSIGKSTFARCKGLTEVIIGDNVTNIGEKAFSTCSSLEALTIGSGVQLIEDKAFIACTGLMQVTCRAAEPPVATDRMWFSNSTCAQATLVVPRGSVEKYRNAFEWDRFTNIVGADLLDLKGDVNGDGEITIADINALIDAILKGDNIKISYDVNGDGEVNIADVNALIDMILSAG